MRSKWLLILVTVIAGATVLFAGTQPWVGFSISSTGAIEEVTGHTASPALSPISIAVMIAAIVLMIAGAVFRRILGALIALLGAGIGWSALSVLTDPAAAVRGRVAELTGLTGDLVEAEVVTELTAWPTAVLVVACVIVLCGIGTLIAAGRWRSSDQRYRSTAERRSSSAALPDRISEWDALSDGEDPT